MAEQLLNARYRLLRPLGTGGMASVYLAEDLRLGRRVAVKILHPQFAADPVFVARFEQEARLAASLSHPGIVRVYDVGHDGDRRYIVMEYVEGETLKDTIARHGALPVARALEISGGVLAALDVAHAHNLIHRDVKAQNILITPDGDVKVADFGIARELGGLSTPTLTSTGMVMGTAQYFAPEQAQGRPATPQSDVYAAGIVLFEMLTGRLPFDGENPLGVAMLQINQPPPRPSTINPSIPPVVETIVLKALAKNPAERYATAGEMKAAADAARTGASNPTRMATRVAPAAAATTPMPTPPPGVIRQSTRPTPVVPPPAPSANRATRRLLWIVAVALIAIVAAALGKAFADGRFGGGTAPTATPTRTSAPSATTTAMPSATKRPIVVPVASPTRPVPTRPVPSQTPTATDTAAPPTATTPAATATDTVAPSPTSAPPSSTPGPTDTVAPAPTDTAAPAPTTQPAATATAPAPSAGAVMQLSPATVRSGEPVTISGSGWPAGATVTLSTDYSASKQVLDSPQAQPDGTFTTVMTPPEGTAAGTYRITADDGQGHTIVQILTITI